MYPQVFKSGLASVLRPQFPRAVEADSVGHPPAAAAADVAARLKENEREEEVRPSTTIQ